MIIKVVQVQVSTGTHGHMAKAKRQIIDDLKIIDIVIEIVDARIPISSQNPDIKEYIKNKKKIIVLNKSDLADEIETKKWIKYFESQNINCVQTDSNSGKGINDILNVVKKISKEGEEKYIQNGRVGKSVRVLILGIPNVGKSSFINRISKKTSAQVGNKPGITKQKQWIRLTEGIELMDTPGILWPKFQTQEIALNLAYTGTIKDEILPKTEIAFSLLKYLIYNYKKNICERYKIDKTVIDEIINSKEYQQENEKILEIFELIGKKRGAIVSGGKVDLEKSSNIILEDFRSGKIGKITLEKEERLGTII